MSVIKHLTDCLFHKHAIYAKIQCSYQILNNKKTINRLSTYDTYVMRYMVWYDKDKVVCILFNTFQKINILIFCFVQLK
jgi:hypothetical protein